MPGSRTHHDPASGGGQQRHNSLVPFAVVLTSIECNMGRFGHRKTAFCRAFRVGRGPNSRIFFWSGFLLLEFPGDFEDSGKTTRPRSLWRNDVISICPGSCVASRLWPHAATMAGRWAWARRFLPAEHDLRRNPRAFSEVWQAMPETNRKRSPRKMAAMSMCCSCCVETRLCPYAASIESGGSRAVYGGMGSAPRPAGAHGGPR